MESADAPSVSIVLNVMGLRELAVYGFRSWLLQDFDQPYEVVLNLFNDARPMFEALREGANPNCRIVITEVPPPAFFNISAANNLGLHVSTGRWVFFANSDIIYPSRFLSRVMSELARRDLYYAVAARANTTPAQVAALRPVGSYSRDRSFDELIGWEKAPGVDYWVSISPWMLRREIAYAIGGFDPRIIMSEDHDLQNRVMHFLRRHGLQETVYAMIELVGYHLHHTSTGLFDAWTESNAILAPRKTRLEADPASEEDILPTRLDDRASIMDDIRRTKKPPLMNQYRKDWRGKIARRAKKVWSAVAYGQ